MIKIILWLKSIKFRNQLLFSIAIAEHKILIINTDKIFKESLFDCHEW